MPGPPPEGAPPAAPAWLPAALAAALVAAVGAAFAGVGGNGFTDFDDDLYVTANPRVQSLSAENLRWMWTDTSLFYWHPLTWTVHALEVAAFGHDPRLHHLTSVLLHGLNAVLVYLLFLAAARAAGTAAPPARVHAAGFAAALLWALHPLRVEPVAWAAGKKELLCTLFVLSALLAWLRRGEAPPERRARWTAAALAATALALLSKPMAMTLPALLLVADAWPLRRFGRPGAWRGLLLEKVPFLLLVVAAVLPSALDPRQDALLPTGAGEALGGRLVQALGGFASGVERTLWPADLVPFYPLPFREDLTLATPRYALAALLLAAASFAAWRAWRRGGAAAPLAAWAFFLVATAPVCGLRQAGSVETADRFAYLPTVALLLLAGGGILAAAVRAGPAIPLGAALALAALLGVLSARQVGVWRDGSTLWTRVAGAFPERVPIAHQNLGAWWHRRAEETGDAAALARAEAEYREALRLRPDHAGARNNLALVLLGRGEEAEAERLLLEAARLRPGFAMAHANLARLYAARGRDAEARERVRLARESREPAPAFLDEVERALGGGR